MKLLRTFVSFAFFFGSATLFLDGAEPLARWSFDEWPNDTPMTLVSGATRVDGVEGQALDCAQPVLYAAPKTVSSDLRALSVTAWVKPRNLSGFREILRKEDGDKRLLFSFQNNGTILSLGLAIWGNYIECDTPIAPEALTDGTWHFVAGTFENGDRGGVFRVWLDGVCLGELGVRGELNIGGAAPIFIGSNDGKSEFFDGLLDDVRLYDTALSESEIVLFKRPDYASLVETLLKQAEEFRPLTDFQRSAMTPDEKTYWEQFDVLAQEIRTKVEKEKKAPQEGWQEQIAALRRRIHSRPMVNEAVAPYTAPSTPETVDLTPEHAEETLRRDWLYQCGGKPTKERILQEIEWTEQLADRLESDVDLSAERDELAALTDRAKKLAGDDADLYFEVRKVKRAVTFKNPAVDFDSVLFADVPYPAGSEWRHETRHRLGYMGQSGGRLLTLTGLSPAGKLKSLMPTEPLFGTFWRPDLSFDAKKVLVSFKPHNEKSFHLYEIGIDGENLRQLTAGAFDDLDPIYLPDGEHIVFSTTRGHTYVRCMPPTNAFVLARMKLDSSDLYLISRNNEPDYTPSLLHDGRIVFSRWEYTDKPLWRCVSLWTMNPDGTQTQTLWGNQSVWPDLPKDVRAVPDSGRLIFTGSAHHDWFAGSIGLIDPSKGLNFPDGLTKITADVSWPETGNGPIDPIESARYHRSGEYDAYDSPCPLSDKDFLVSARRGGRDGKYVLLLMDSDGNRELIYEGTHNIFFAQPIRPRTKPPVIVDRVIWPQKGDSPAPGVIYSNNVYDNAPPELAGKAKYLRIFNIEPKTYTFWNRRPYISIGPVVSMVQTDGVKRILGTVPIEKDGSVSFYAPSGVALHFQLIDENGRCLQTMRSFTGVMPGEQRGCLGCHASQITTPAPQRRSLAVLREPSSITPPAWDDISISYERYVQPTLDKQCGKCHSGDGKAKKIFDTTLRPGFLHFKEPYITLVGNPAWSRPQQIVAPGKRNQWNDAPADAILDREPPGFGIADTILVEAYNTTDPAGYSTPKPMEKLSYASRLINQYCQSGHYGVELSPTEIERMILWVDAMCPYMGSDDVRADDDPTFQGSDWLSVKPRLKTAPVVRRPGPFDAFGNDSEIYAPPTDQAIYANPALEPKKE